MNDESREELRLARAVCGHLDQSLERLPHRVGVRLAASRRAALAAVPSNSTAGLGARARDARAPAFRAAPATASDRRARTGSGWRLPRLAITPRLGYALVPALVAAIGFAVLWPGSDGSGGADEQAAVADTSMITDDVPLTAYADRGFGVYMRNTLDLGRQGNGMVRVNTAAPRSDGAPDPGQPPSYNP